MSADTSPPAVAGRPVVLCDVGDVLVHTVPGAQYRALERITGRARASIAQLVRASGIGAALELGELSPAEFTECLGRLVNCPGLQIGDVHDAWQSELAGADPLLIDAAARLADQGQLVLASNTNAFHWPTVWSTLRQAGVTAPAYLSFHLGVAKPDRRFFAAVAEDLPFLLTSSDVFIDDQPANVDAANWFGLTGVVHVSPSTTAAYLNAIADACTAITSDVSSLGVRMPSPSTKGT